VKITVNGKDYESWDDVPAEVRKLVGNTLPDTDGDGVPDLMEGHGTLPTGSSTFTSTSIVVDGKTYNSIDEIPADVRATLQSAGLLGGPQNPNTSPPMRVGGKIVVPPVTTPVGQSQLGPGQVLLNGEVVNVDSAPKRKHWWNRR
jgi:hypothetical protein